MVWNVLSIFITKIACLNGYHVDVCVMQVMLSCLTLNSAQYLQSERKKWYLRDYYVKQGKVVCSVVPLCNLDSMKTITGQMFKVRDFS